jgi:hypothetical protein
MSLLSGLVYCIYINVNLSFLEGKLQITNSDQSYNTCILLNLLLNERLVEPTSCFREDFQQEMKCVFRSYFTTLDLSWSNARVNPSMTDSMRIAVTLEETWRL